MFSFLNNRFKFNPDTLSYEKVELTTKEKIAKISGGILFFASGIFLVAFLVFGYFYNTTSRGKMLREKKQLITQYEKLEGQLELAEAVLSDIEQRDDNIYRMMLNKEPVSSTKRDAGFGGVDSYKALRGLKSSELVIATALRLDKLSKRLEVQSKSYDQVITMAKENSEMLKCIPAIIPVTPTKSHISSKYGFRIHPILKTRRMHTGVDFSAPRGTKIYATGDGVIESTRFTGGYGRQIMVSHGHGYKSRYAHLYKILVKRGQKVKRGDVIGLVGNTGLSTSSHLHYEITKNNKHVNPVDYYYADIDPKEYAALKK